MRSGVTFTDTRQRTTTGTSPPSQPVSFPLAADVSDASRRASVNALMLSLHPGRGFQSSRDVAAPRRPPL